MVKKVENAFLYSEFWVRNDYVGSLLTPSKISIEKTMGACACIAYIREPVKNILADFAR